MENHIVRPSVVAVALVALTVACGESPTSPSGTGTGNNTATVTSVTISGSVSVVEGSTSQLKAAAAMSNGTSKDVTNQATWRSSDPTVATVSGTGLVTTLKIGTSDVTAAFESQTGRSTLQVRSATFIVKVDLDSVTALGTCDDFTQGLTTGEFAVRVRAISGGDDRTMVQTTGYPGNPSNLLVFSLAKNASQHLGDTTSFTLPGQSGQSVQVVFNATEWDEQIVIIPPSTRWIHDDSMDDRSTFRTHSYVNGTFGSLGSNTLTIGDSSCGLRLGYAVSATK